MGALPKNKITRAERGKRRRGNTKSVTQDVKVVKVAPYKQGLVSAILKSIGLA